MRRIWAAFERVIPRAVLAVTTVMAAAVTDPHAIGIYSWAVLILTLHQSLTDQAIRHLAVVHVVSSGGLAFLRRYAFVAGASGAALMAAAVVVIVALSGRSHVVIDVANLLPLIFVPCAQAAAVRPTAELQRNQLWAKVSLWRTISSLIGVAFGVAVVLTTRSIMGACIAILVSELSFTAMVRRSSLNGPQRELSDGTPSTGTWRTFGHMAVYSGLAWLQGQSERVFLGAWAGTAALGSYSLGLSVGRSAGDAIAASQANVLRVDLSESALACDDDLRVALGRHLRAALFLAWASAILTVALAWLLLAPFLGEEWQAALKMVPVLALTAIPSAVAWSSAPVHIQRGKARSALLAPALCLLMAPLIALAAMSSLVAAAWVVLLRDCVLAATQLLLMGRAAPWREAAIGGGILVAGAAFVATFGSF
ncbi:O-antigen/teichoic acid export membrane protein [Mycobacterium sp. BK558]|nr:O-antigen/teichoic acid export membrane protein [Mycobacterium sp. BK558]